MYVIRSRATQPPKEGKPKVRELTGRQTEVLTWIKDYLREHGYPPSRAELANGLGLSDASSVTGHLNALADHGWIELRPKIGRGIRVLNQDLPVIGPLAEVTAGEPILAESHIVRRLPPVMADQFRPRPDYFLTVAGDSMNRTGLLAGDIVAIHKTPAAKNGQVVVARFGDEVTLKRFVRVDDRYVELRPESTNPEHKTMKLDLAKHIVEIDGIAVGALIGAIQDMTTASKRGI